MYYLFGLGNSGKRFTHTRHNVGHILAKLLAKERLADFISFTNRETLMNKAGSEVKLTVEQNNISLDKLIVVHDDMDVPLGEFRLQRDRGFGGHKGVVSVIDALGSKDFYRLRVGIGHPPEGTSPSSFVLGKLSKDELVTIRSIIPAMAKALVELKAKG